MIYLMAPLPSFPPFYPISLSSFSIVLMTRLLTHESRVILIIRLTSKITRVFLSLQEKDFLLTRDSSHNSDSSIHYLPPCRVAGLRLCALAGLPRRRRLPPLLQRLRPHLALQRQEQVDRRDQE